MNMLVNPQPSTPGTLVTSHRPESFRARIGARRGFSLIEVLLAIMILGIGVISIAALFPAGIAQQRQSVDDSIGPIIANNAIALIRSKIRQDDFGAFEDFGIATANTPRPTVPGDWCWLRPGYLFTDNPATLNVDERGSIDIFSGTFNSLGTGSGGTEFPGNSGYVGSNPRLRGIPYNPMIYGNTAPTFMLTRGERYYPMASQNLTIDPGKPQYVWDCMFRRFQGRILVAIFVYRVAAAGGGNMNYSAQPDTSNPNLPPLPIWLNMEGINYWSPGTTWYLGGLDRDVTTNEDNAIVPGTAAGTPFNLDDIPQAWEASRQWILDQNNNIHRVLGVESDDPSVDVRVELAQPLADIAMHRFPLQVLPVYYPQLLNNNDYRLVTDIWYLPLSMDAGNGVRWNITPVYVTVKEL